MSAKKDLLDKPLYAIPNYVYALLLSSFYFLICNPLLLIFYIITFINSSNFNFILLFISLIPLGPSIVALYLSMSKLIFEKNFSISSYFFSLYKNNFKSTMKIWLLELLILFLFTMDSLYFYINLPSYGIHIIFILLSIYILIVSLYLFPINSKFEIKFKDLIILSFYYSLKKFPITLLKIAILILIIKISSYIPSLIMLFLPSIISILFVYYDNSIFKEIEAKYDSSNDLDL